MTFDVQNILTALGIIGALLLASRTFGKWQGSIDGMLKELKASSMRHDEEILSLRASRHDSGEAIVLLKAQTASLEEDMGAIFEDRRAGERRRKP